MALTIGYIAQTLKRVTVFASIALLLTSFTYAGRLQSPEAGVTKSQAIAQAEVFVKNNGYTSLSPDKSKLRYEVFDSQERNVDAILANRRNLLQAKAYCLAEDDEYWYIGFLYRIQLQSALRGRVVLVRKDGRAIRIAHLDPDFSVYKKL